LLVHLAKVAWLLVALYAKQGGPMEGLKYPRDPPGFSGISLRVGNHRPGSLATSSGDERRPLPPVASVVLVARVLSGKCNSPPQPQGNYLWRQRPDWLLKPPSKLASRTALCWRSWWIDREVGRVDSSKAGQNRNQPARAGKVSDLGAKTISPIN
jgi:hypothetical protein